MYLFYLQYLNILFMTYFNVILSYTDLFDIYI